jgi:imidazolonepropionase-like amidohydrolase
MTIALVNGHVIDCVRPGARRATVVVADDRIADVIDGAAAAPAGAAIVDLAGSYLLPGLWDVHVHLEWPRIASATVAELTVQYSANAVQGLLEAGVTAIRTAGTPHFIDVALKRAYAEGRLLGPRIFAGGWFLTTTAGHALGTGFARTCDGPTGFVRAIREQMEHGVDHIKLNLSGGIFGPSWDRHWHSFLLEEELEAAFQICRQRGYPVMAHATNPDAVKAAIRLGAHSVEHGYIMDDECLTLFRERDTWYVPTLGITHLTPAQSATEWESCWVAQRGLTPDIVVRAEDAAPEHRGWFQKALRARVKMALGSDLRPLRDSALLEMELWVKDGASPEQTIVAATRHAADLCGLACELGTVEAGRIADLIVVRQNPLDDIHHLRGLELVLKDGRVVADHRGGTGAIGQ